MAIPIDVYCVGQIIHELISIQLGCEVSFVEQKCQRAYEDRRISQETYRLFKLTTEMMNSNPNNRPNMKNVEKQFEQILTLQKQPNEVTNSPIFPKLNIERMLLIETN